MLSAKRIERRDLYPFAIVGAVLLAVCSVCATVYVPHLFSRFATRYGVIGAVFAMISAIFCVMVVVVGSAAAGREIDDEFDRIRRGECPPTMRSAASGTRSPPRRGRAGTRCGSRSRSAGAVNATREADGFIHVG